jgi:hypothetical protein
MSLVAAVVERLIYNRGEAPGETKTERDGTMRVIWVVLSVAFGSPAISGCTETAGGQAFAEQRQVSERLCLDEVARRTGNSNVAVVNHQHVQQYMVLWIGVGPKRTQYQCTVDKDGPDSYEIRNVRKV